MLPNSTIIEEYLDGKGASPFADWFERLDAVSNVKGVGEGVFEFRIDYGPGYRIYFGRDGDRLVILLAGGTKRRQDDDIAAAKARWSDYKARKKGGA